MLRRLIQWLRPAAEEQAPGMSHAELERRLAVLEAEAAEADPGFQGVPLNRAGSLCMEAGDRSRALIYLGRAIDAYLEGEQPEAARAVARKLIRLHPRAVRTLCTITWLDLAGSYHGDALLHLGEYVEAAKRSGRQELCRDQILAMARIVPDPQFRGSAAEGLEDLGYPEEAAMIRERVDLEEGPDGGLSGDELRTRCYEAAVGSNIGSAGF